MTHIYFPLNAIHLFETRTIPLKQICVKSGTERHLAAGSRTFDRVRSNYFNESFSELLNAFHWILTIKDEADRRFQGKCTVRSTGVADIGRVTLHG
jgi:hypothetical protein